MKHRIVCLILLLAVVGCTASRAPRPTQIPVSNTSVSQARLQGLEDRGAAEVMPAEQYHAVDRAVRAAVDSPGIAKATRSLNEFEAAFNEVASQEAISARDACIRLEMQVEKVVEQVAGGEGCEGLQDSIADLEDQVFGIRSLAYTVGGDVRISLQVQRLVTDARVAMNDVFVDAAVCGTVRVDPDNADQMFEAAGQLAKTGLAFGSAVRLYARIAEGVPGTETAAAALTRIAALGPDLQQKLAATVRSAAAACDAETAHLNFNRLEGLMVALSECAADLVDPSVRWAMPDLKRLVRAADERCPTDRVVHHPDPVHTPAPPSVQVVEIENLIAGGHINEARARIAALARAEEKNRLKALLDANTKLAEAEALLRAGDFDAAIPLAESAWQSELGDQAGRVLAECRSARAEAILAGGRPENALVEAQRALIAAPDSGRAQRTAAAVLERLGGQALASGDVDEALRLFRESTMFHDNGGLHLEMARLLVARQQFQEACTEEKHAGRLGESIDAATRLQSCALSFLISGDIEAALREIDTIAGKNVRAVKDLRTHLLRLPLSGSVGRLAADLASAGGLARWGAGVLAFVGSDTSDLGDMVTVFSAGAPGPNSSGFSNDYRYMFFSDLNGKTIVFDARSGHAAGWNEGELATGQVRSFAALARAEVVETLAWLLVIPLEDALNSDMERAEQYADVLSALRGMVKAGLDYALLADPGGKATHAVGALRENYETGLKVAVVSAPNTRLVTIEGSSYREIVAPVKIGGSVQAMLVLGVAEDP